MSIIEKKYELWEEKINQEYSDLFSVKDKITGHKIVPDFLMDGVIDPDKYKETKIKILFLNREPNDEGADGWLNHKLKNQIENKERIFPNKRNNDFTYNLLGEYLVIQLLSNEKANEMTDDEINHWVTERVNSYPNQYQDFMLYTSYMNLKKIGGESSIDNDAKITLIEATAKGWVVLQKQILYFNPTIIVGGNISKVYLDRDDNRLTFKWIDKPEYADNGGELPLLQGMLIGDKEFPLLDLYHPSYKYEHNTYSWAQIYRLLKRKEESNKDYWTSRYNQSCFDCI